MDYLAGQILDFIKAHPEWAAFVIGLVAFGVRYGSLADIRALFWGVRFPRLCGHA